ncbi:MAG: hypothetical protein V8R49_06125 [Duodenibacillus massiliensis]
MLVATILVLFMTIPGIALFYGGMARKKTFFRLRPVSVICCALSVVWAGAGYLTGIYRRQPLDRQLLALLPGALTLRA